MMRASTMWAVALAAAVITSVPGARAADAPKAYVGLFRDDAVAVIDTGTNQVVKRIAVPKGPHGLVVTPDGRKVYVSSDGASVVSVIDTVTDRVTATVDVGPNPHGLAMAPDGKLVLVSAWGANEALFIDTASDRIVGRVPVPRPTTGPSPAMAGRPGSGRNSRARPRWCRSTWRP